MKLRTKIYLCFGFLVFMILFLSATAINITGKLKNNMDQMVVQRYEVVRLANIFRYEFSNTYIPFQELRLMDFRQSNVQERLRQIDLSREKAILALEALEKISNEEHFLDVLPELKLKFNDRIQVVKKLHDLLESGQMAEAIDYAARTGTGSREQVNEMVNGILASQENLMKDTLASSEKLYRQATWTFLVISMLGIILFMGIAIIVFRSITVNINKLTKVMSNISYQDSIENLPRVSINSNDELGDIASAFNKMAGVLEEQYNHEKIYNQSMQEQSWVKSTIAEFSMLYHGHKDLKNFGEQLIKKLTPLVGASYGAFYLLEEQEGQNYLNRIATYAFDGKAVASQHFRLGEGLVGECALENRLILLSPAPDNYIRIISGLGSAQPKYIIVLPVAFDGQVVAVIELASLSEFSPVQRELFGHLLDYTGIVINRISNQMKVEKLLAESQSLTEELQAQSEELQLQQEELRTSSEKLEEQYKDSQLKTAELEQIKISLEEQARQLELSSRYKSEFLSNMSHELRTPLNSQLVLAQILSENADGNLTAKQVEYAKTILSSGQDLLNIINDILDLAKVESGKMQVDAGEVSLQNIKKFVEQNYLPIAKEKGIKFSVLMDRDLPEIIYTDETKLKQIIKNLLSNAFKFTEWGKVLLQIKEVSRLAPGDKGSFIAPMLAISVKDTGVGIPKEKQQVIFEEFQQADGSTNRKYGGTGLGLSISRKLAELLGGFIELISQPGEGSTFTLYLPLEINSALLETAVSEMAVGDRPSASNIDEATAVEEHEQELLAGSKILIVDDDMRNVFALTAALENNGIETLFAENGRAGIEALQANPDIDLVLMDMMMPEMDGYETMRVIRQMPEYETLPIIALTAKAMKFDREKCINAGASDYISKPVDLEKLFSLIQVWLYK
ncbi:MAG: ATP-binding protein [Desulfotomaculaceae bacterium]|nr:ATP-binding protein [Desulfotomaculaceae bacterium]